MFESKSIASTHDTPVIFNDVAQEDGAGAREGESEGGVSMSRDLIDTLRLPLVLLDGERRVLHVNARAQRLLARGDLLFACGGRLACRDAASEAKLAEAMREVFVAAGDRCADAARVRRVVRLRRRDGRILPGLLLSLWRSPEQPLHARSCRALLTVLEPDHATPADPQIVCATFDLTPAEGRLAAMIGNGRTPQECADELRVKISTVRTQLASIYRKTGACGQPDLVRLILSMQVL